MDCILIIKTDRYAGNFEREMSGYCCGYVSDWEDNHGEDEAREFREKFPDAAERIGDIIDWQGENPCYACEAIDYSKNGCKDVAIYFTSIPDQDLIDLIKQRAIEFGETRLDHLGNPDKVKVLGFSLVKKTVTTIYEEL